MRFTVFAAFAMIGSQAIASPTVLTPSGQPEAIFMQTSLADAAGKIASACMDKGWSVTAQSANEVTCQVPFGGFKQALAGALVGNAYSTPPNIFAQFNMAQISGNVRVQGRAWMETQMAFGQVRQMPYTDAKTKTALMGFLYGAGGSLPNGTVFTGTYLGIEDQKGAPASTVRVTHVYLHAPAHDAGLQDGDLITAIDGKGFKDEADFGKRLERVKDPTYTLSIVRGGQNLTLTVPHRDRPIVGSDDFVALEAEVKKFRSQQ